MIVDGHLTVNVPVAKTRKQVTEYSSQEVRIPTSSIRTQEIGDQYEKEESHLGLNKPRMGNLMPMNLQSPGVSCKPACVQLCIVCSSITSET
jgi:hypothetical protein